MKLTDENIICPFCDSEFVHIEKVAVYHIQGVMDCLIDDGGIHTDTSSHSDRGAIISIVFWCENGEHRWMSKMQFHKGMVLFQNTELKWDELLPDLWRD